MILPFQINTCLSWGFLDTVPEIKVHWKVIHSGVLPGGPAGEGRKMTSGKCHNSVIPWEALEGMSNLSASQLDAHNPGTIHHGLQDPLEGCVSSHTLLALQIAKMTPRQGQPSEEAGRLEHLGMIHKEGGGWAERTYRNDLRGQEP